jgi:hypothetical protein
MSFEELTENHRPPSTELFLDTSIHCSKLKGPLFLQRIDSVFRLFPWKSTSTYTKVEFGNVVLAQAEYYLRKLNEFGSLAKTKDFIGNVLQHKLHPLKVTWSFNLLDQYGEGDEERTERARLYLQRMMKLGVDFVEKLCDRPLADGTECYWAARGVHKRHDGRLVWQAPVCKRDRKRCRLDEFFVDNRDVFVRIKHAIDALPECEKSSQLGAFSEVIAQALEDPGVLLDYRSGCKRLADAIIAVDSRSYTNLFSQNIKESELLTTVLEQMFYYLPANPVRGVMVKVAARSSGE